MTRTPDEPCAEFGSHPRGAHEAARAAAQKPPVDAQGGGGNGDTPDDAATQAAEGAVRGDLDGTSVERLGLLPTSPHRAEGPATVTPPLTEREAADQMERTRGIVAGWQGLSEGPATVTPAERDALRTALVNARWQDALAAVAVSMNAREQNVLRSEVKAEAVWYADAAIAAGWLPAARVDALTADRIKAEQVIANVRALADEWQDAIDGRTANPGGWGQRLRALLPAAPTGDDEEAPDVLAEAFAVHLSAAPTGEDT